MKRKLNFPKRLFATVLSAVMALTTVPVIGTETAQAAVNTLTGVSETHWARNSIEKMVNQNILSGDKDGNLHPDRPVTRAEYIAMINRAFGYDSVRKGDLPFKDIEGTEWYADHIRIAYQQGYFSGIDKSTAGATRPITREEAAAMICRNLKIESTTPQIDKFADGKTVSQWSKAAVGAAVDKGFIHGYTDGSFRPKNNISRAEAATMFSNAMGTIYSRGGNFGQGMIEGNVTIASSRVNLQDTVITGDLYITEGVGTGAVNLRNVTVLGEVIVCGGGEGNFGGNSVTLDSCTIWKLTVDGPETRPVSLYAKGNTNIPETNIKSTTYLQNHPETEVGFDNIEVKGPVETKLYLAGGSFENVAVMQPENGVLLGRGTVKNLTVDEDAIDSQVTLDRNVVVENMNLDSNAAVTGRGDIENLIVTTDNASVESLPDQVEVRPGFTSNIAGQEMTSLDADESSSAPKITAGYPKAREITSSAAKVYFQTNKPGTIYWALTYDDAEELDEDEILKPTTITRIQKYGTLKVDESEKEIMMSLSGMESNATYVLSAVLVDAREDVSRIKEEEIETADQTQPGFVSGYPRTVPHASNSFLIQAMPTKAGSLYWAVFKKGAAAPTAYQLRSQNLDGDICHGKVEDIERNIEYEREVVHTDLHEKETYDVYVMVSDGERDSKIVKLSAVTKDTTPPKYKPDPRPDKNDKKMVSATLGADEPCTVYYVLVDWDDQFPVPVPTDPSYPKQPELTSDAAKKQVLNGNNVLKAGKAKVKDSAEATVKVSGLAEETPYRMYMLLEDEAGNLADEVKMVEVKTRDVTPPVAKIEFENSIEGKADVEENIMLVFNEIVCYPVAEALLKDQVRSTLKDGGIFKLLDVSSTEEVEVEIDYEKISFEEGEKGATIVVFPPEAFKNPSGTQGLNSGATYKFILNKLMDTTGNTIDKDLELPVFQTAPPLVILTQTNNPFDPKYNDVDYAFTMEPEAQQTSDRVLFDIIFESDTDISFELYRWDKTEDNPTLRWIQINPAEGTALDKNTPGVTLHQILDVHVGKQVQPSFEKFSTLDLSREYAVKITRIGSDSERGGWDAIVNMDVKCVAGEYDDLVALAKNPVGNYNTVLGKGKVSMVNYSTQNMKDTTEFIMQMSFSDTIVPKFIEDTVNDLYYPVLNPKLTGQYTQVGDVFIAPQLMTDRRAMMYYIIAPYGAIQLKRYEADDPNGKYKKGEPTPEALNSMAYGIISNSYKAAGSFWGSYQLESGNSLYQPRMPENGKGELYPQKDYELFCVLKGTPTTPSDVYYRSFTTDKIEPPVLTAQVVGKWESSAEIRISTKDARTFVEWIIMPEGDIKDYLKKDSVTGAVISTQIADNYQSYVANEIIRNGAKDETLSFLSYGRGTAEWNEEKQEYEMYVDALDLEENTRYVLLGVGKMQLNTGETVGDDAQIVVSEPFEKKDMTPPVIKPDKNFRLQGRVTNPSASIPDDQEDRSYAGYFRATFTEGLYYRPSGSAKAVPLSKADFITLFNESVRVPGMGFTITEDDLLTKTVGKGEDGKDLKAVYDFTVHYTGATDGVYVWLDMGLCDIDGNMAPTYEFEFHDMEGRLEEGETDLPSTTTQRLRSYWTYAEYWNFDVDKDDK